MPIEIVTHPFLENLSLCMLRVLSTSPSSIYCCHSGSQLLPLFKPRSWFTLIHVLKAILDREKARNFKKMEISFVFLVHQSTNRHRHHATQCLTLLTEVLSIFGAILRLDS